MIEAIIAVGAIPLVMWTLTVLPVRMFVWLMNDSHLAFRDQPDLNHVE